MKTTAALALLLLSAPALAQESPRIALGGLDPVALCAGDEVEGSPERTADRHLYRYRFATDEHRKQFLDRPEAYEIQMGGGCGRMGPLSGRGGPARFWVHDRRIYVFASDPCREAFKKAPEKFLDPDETLPAGDEAARQRGRELLEAAVKALGGRDRLRSLKGFEFSHSRKVPNAQGERDVGSRFAVLLPSSYRHDQHDGEWNMATITTPDDGFDVLNSGKVEDLHSTGQRELRRTLRRNPFLILQAFAATGLEAVATGGSEIEGTPVVDVAILWDGCLTRLWIDPASGRVLATTARARGPELWYGESRWTWTDFKDVSGLTLPHRADLAFEGKPRPDSTRVFSFLIDPPFDPGHFLRPAR